ncbi:CaiB/BaiF CoA transferase family protein [Chloroflexota bacterium]
MNVTQKIFADVKIAEFAWVAVGPQSSRYLADHGATVVRIESHTHFDLLRANGPYAEGKPGVDRSMFFGKYNANKYGASLNLNHPRGNEIAWKFIQWADIMTESFRPGMMKRWGLDYDSVSKVKPEIIYLSTSMQGRTGPSSQYAGVGSLISAIAGFGEITGWPDRMPSPPYGAYTDYFCQRFNSAAIIAALDYRRRTGKGQWIEQSQLETSVYFNAPVAMDYMVNKRVAGRQGNRLSYSAPHGVYPCKGDDRWIAIAVFDDKQWHSFCHVIGNPDWTSKSKFNTLIARKQNEDELDNLVAQWTSQHGAEEIETSMQSAGIASGMVEKNADLFEDPQLKHREYYVWLEHPEMGKPAYQQQADFILSKTLREVTMPSPCLGEHNEYVYKELLGMTDDEIADYIAEGVITTGIS